MPIGGWDIASILAKAVSYAATLATAGGVFFLQFCAGPVPVAARFRIQRVLWLLLLVALILCAFRVALLAASLSGGIDGMFDGSLIRMLLRGREGNAVATRLIGLALIAWGFRSPRPQSSWLALTGAALAATSFAWVGHSLAAPAKSMSVVSIVLHLFGVSFWLGALVPLLIVARDQDATCISQTALRFGRLALVVVPLLLVAGVVLLLILLGKAPGHLWSSDYGRMVTVKLGLVLCLLMLAAFNKWRLTPRLQRGDLGALQELKRSINAEIAVGAAILVITATFTTLMGPPTQ